MMAADETLRLCVAFYSGVATAYLIQGACHTIRLSGTHELDGTPMLNRARLGFSFGYVVLSAAVWPITAALGLIFALRGQPRTERIFQRARLWFYAARLSPRLAGAETFLNVVERRLYNELADEEGLPRLSANETVPEDAWQNGEGSFADMVRALGGTLAEADPDLERIDCEGCNTSYRAYRKQGGRVVGPDLITSAEERGWLVAVEFDGVNGLCRNCLQKADEEEKSKSPPSHH